MTRRIEVPAREARVAEVDAGQLVRVIDVEGGQVGDTWAFVRDDPSEYQSAEHTRVHVGKLFPAVGEQFVTNRRRPILELVADNTPGHHDMLIAACDPARYEQLGVEGWHASCQENLLRAMEAAGHPDVEIPQPINLFMNTPFLPDGRVRWLESETAAGDSVTFRALLDCYVVVSACPQDVVGINRGPQPLAIEVGDAEEFGLVPESAAGERA